MSISGNPRDQMAAEGQRFVCRRVTVTNTGEKINVFAKWYPVCSEGIRATVSFGSKP